MHIIKAQALVSLVLYSALLLSHFLTGQMANANPFGSSNAGDLLALCNGDQVELRTIRHLDKLFNNLNSNPHLCPPRTRQAIADLYNMAHDKKACTMKKAKAITDFVDEYLKRPFENQQMELPRPLVKFAIAYGMKVSNVCQKFMVRRFVKEADVELKKSHQQDLEDFKWNLFRSSPLYSVLAPIVRTGEIILPTDLMEVVPGLDTKLHEYYTKSEQLAEMKVICETQLQPLYEPVLLPLAHLIRAGFNNRDYYYRRHFRYEAQFWSTAVFSCETLKAIKMPENENSSPISDNQSTSQLAQSDDDQKEEPNNSADQIEFNESIVPDDEVDGKIYGRFDFSTKALVKSFDANKSEAERLSKRILERSLKVFKEISKKFRHTPVIKKFFKELILVKGSDKDLDEAKRSLLELVDAPDEVTALYKVQLGFELAAMLGKLLLAFLVAFFLVLPMWLMNVPEDNERKAVGWIYSWL